MKCKQVTNDREWSVYDDSVYCEDCGAKLKERAVLFSEFDSAYKFYLQAKDKGSVRIWNWRTDEDIILTAKEAKEEVAYILTYFKEAGISKSEIAERKKELEASYEYEQRYL